MVVTHCNAWKKLSGGEGIANKTSRGGRGDTFIVASCIVFQTSPWGNYISGLFAPLEVLDVNAGRDVLPLGGADYVLTLITRKRI